MRVRKILPAMLCVVVGLIACETNFEPLKENNEYYFSLYGTIDASADTQWVRVMPVRDSIFTSPEPLDVTVTLTRKSNGDLIILEDSLFKLRNNYYAWNYWTDEQIYPGEEYYLEAENNEGGISSVDLFIPPDYPTPVVDYKEDYQLARIYVKNVDRLVVADIKYYFRSINKRLGEVSDKIYSESYPQVDDVREDYYEDTKVVFAYPEVGFNDLASRYVTDQTGIQHIRQEIIIVSGGPGWPDIGDLPEDERFLPGTVSNVDHGLGVVAGIVSKTVPLLGCYDSQGEAIACPLLKSRNKPEK